MDDRVDRAFRTAFGRSPSSGERARSLAYLARMTEYHRAHAPPKPPPAGKIVRAMVTEQNGEPVDVGEDDEPLPYEHNLHASEVSPAARALADLCLVLLNTNEFVYVY